ncbi:uncharacterized protein [Penaeus vannamei]|uniref:uncharacterized protein n=1 Tax=Penaeus vannamei TaxID=6689 RepID=UPI00387F7ED6
MASGLHAVLTAIWRPSTIPTDLLRGVVIPFWKGKGEQWDCSNHRGITLLSIPSKVLAYILLRRTRNHLMWHQRPEQSGFTPGKSTIDHILALRVTVERHRELGRGLLAAYIDLKKSINMVHWESLWEILRLRGIPTRIIGPPQLDIADDVDILVESLESLVVALSAFSNEAKSLGLEVSWTKTKEVSRRIGLVAGVMNSLNKSLWRCRYLCRRTKLRVFKALIMPVLLYGSETWILSCALESHLDAFCNQSFHRIMGYCWRDHVSNQRLHHETASKTPPQGIAA